jgi:hypothetical protein
MSKEIICIAAAAAEPNILLTLSCCQRVCKNLTDRLKEKLNTKNPHLLEYINSAIYYLELCEKDFDFLSGYAKPLSSNATKLLHTESTQLLHAIRHLEYLIRPFEHGWVVIPQDVRYECHVVIITLASVTADMWLIREIRRRARYLRSVSSDSLV